MPTFHGRKLRYLRGFHCRPTLSLAAVPSLLLSFLCNAAELKCLWSLHARRTDDAGVTTSHQIRQQKESKLKQQRNLLSSSKVKFVSAPESDILPPDVITQCAKESNLIGGTLTPETLGLTANMINRQYMEHGYVMNSVTGATLVPSSDRKENDGQGHVELKVGGF